MIVCEEFQSPLAGGRSGRSADLIVFDVCDHKYLPIDEVGKNNVYVFYIIKMMQIFFLITVIRKYNF